MYTVRVKGRYKIIKNHLGHLSLYLEHCYSVHGTLLLYPMDHCYSILGTLLLYTWNTATLSPEHCYSIPGTLLLYPWTTVILSLEHCYSIPGTLLLYPWNTATISLEKEKEQTPGNFNVRIERHRVPNVLLLIDGS